MSFVSSNISHQTVSVVISTLNRAELLNKSLKSLEYQNFPEFEVVVVNGPSKDNTEEVCSKYEGNIIYGTIPDANLSKSRNKGINLSSGDLVLFLDDDAFAEPDWISNIVDGYADPKVGGVGTRVYDHTGFAWQQNPFLIDKYYNPNFEMKPPLWAFEFANSNTIPHILGASSSFRRDALEQIGGFDEEIEYFLDESEVCRRISELGYKIRFVNSGASVHHQFAAGVTRDERRLLTHPYPVVKNKYYVCLSDWRRNGGELRDYLSACDAWLKELTDGAQWQLNHGGISRSEYDAFMADVARGARDGRRRASTQSRKSIAVTPARADRLVRFPACEPPSGRKTFCFISRHIPSSSPNGIARYIWDLATGFARRGHETHLITLTDGPARIEFLDGLWIRHLSRDDLVASGVQPHAATKFGPLQSGAARMNIAWAKAAHREVLRLRNDRYIDLVVAPVWDQEGLYCVLDRRLNTVVSMNTTFRRFAKIEGRNLDAFTVAELDALEKTYVHSARLFHANSTSSAAHLAEDFGIGPEPRVVAAPHGVADIDGAALERIGSKQTAAGKPVRVLYVSRLEKRKGVDIFLKVASSVLQKHPGVIFEIVGKNCLVGDTNDDFNAYLKKSYPKLSESVLYHGQVSDKKLNEIYESADIFFVPSRYESFGIVFVEAMRFELPVLAMDIGGAQDIVQHGVTGFLGGNENVSELAGLLDDLVADTGLRSRMGAAARARYSRLFENEVVIDSTLEAFSNLLADPYEMAEII